VAETVLCGVIRVSDRSSRVPVLRRILKKVVPFVYLSRSNDSSSLGGTDLPIIEDRFRGHESFVNGLHSSLRILRQPILYLSSNGDERIIPEDLQALVNRWDQCGDRLSGVLFPGRNGSSLRRCPGLYASPLLPGLRKLQSKQGNLESMLKSEPIRTVSPVQAQS
jgi:hypothetical protein